MSETASLSTAPTRPTERRPGIHPLAFIPGVTFWGLIAAGFATENTAFFGASVVVFAVSAVVLITYKVKRSSAERAELARIWTEGLPATAVVKRISTKGGGMNGHPRVDFELEVTPPSGAAYAAATSVIVDKLAIPRIQPGCAVEVRIDPADRGSVVVDEALTYLGYRR